MIDALLVTGSGAAVPFEQHARLQTLIGQAQSLLGRRDGITPTSAMGHLRREENVRRFDAMGRTLAETRNDSFEAGMGFYQARQLEQIYPTVLREEYPKRNAMTLFNIDTSISPGVRYHTVQRIYDQGEIAVYRAGLKVPTVNVAAYEERFPIKHYVTSIVYDLFEALSSGYANTSKIAEMMRVARDIMEEFVNFRSWYGADAEGFFGVLNYPWLRKKIIAQGMYSGAVASDGDKQSIVDAVLELWHTPADDTLSTFSPTDMAVSGRLIRFWKRTYFNSVKETVFSRIADIVGEANIHEASELKGVGPGGTDGILCYRKDRLGISNTIVQPMTGLPLQEFGFDSRQFFYMTHGGVIMRNVANNILGWVEAEA